MTDETMITAAEARALALARQRHADGYHMAKMPHAAIEDVGALLRALEASEAALKASEERVGDARIMAGLILSAYDPATPADRAAPTAAAAIERAHRFLLDTKPAAISPEEGGRVAAAAEAHNAAMREQGRREGLLDAANRLNANPPQPHTSDETPAFYAGFDCGVEAAVDVLHSLVADTDERDDPDDLAAGSQEPRE